MCSLKIVNTIANELSISHYIEVIILSYITIRIIMMITWDCEEINDKCLDENEATFTPGHNPLNSQIN